MGPPAGRPAVPPSRILAFTMGGPTAGTPGPPLLNALEGLPAVPGVPPSGRPIVNGAFELSAPLIFF